MVLLLSVPDKRRKNACHESRESPISIFDDRKCRVRHEQHFLVHLEGA